jgi:hypothetical protein
MTMLVIVVCKEFLRCGSIAEFSTRDLRGQGPLVAMVKRFRYWSWVRSSYGDCGGQYMVIAVVVVRVALFG